MENLSHSVLKKACNANGFGAKTVYDDVFGGPPKFGIPTLSSRAEDYSEIFGSFHASRASSIPILDLPPVDEAEFSFDVRSSMFDYSEVFGGLNGLDFAVSFEELCNQSKTAYDSSDEVWTPAQSEFLSDESDPSASSERNQSLSNGESHQSCDGIKQFNVSYNKASQSSKEDMSSGTVHVTQLHAVPGFTFVVNETPTSKKIEDSNTQLQFTDDLNPNMVLSGGLREGKQLRKTMSHPPNSSFGIQNLGTDLKPVGKTASHKNETFVTVSDISLRTQPSQLPPPLRPPHVLAVNDGDSDRQKPKLKASKSFAFGETTGESSPPFFDVEVDASSSAAASAAAMKDVMEKAQAKLKSAKELMERKKERLQSHTKLGLKNDTKDEGKASKTFDGSNSFKEGRVHGICQRDCSGMIAFAGEEGQNVMKTTQVPSNSIEGGKHISLAKMSADRKHAKESRSSQEFKTEETVPWREAAQVYEVVEMDKSRKIFVQAKDERVLVQNTESHQHGQEKKANPAFQQQEEDNRKMKADREAHEWDGNKGRSKDIKESTRQENNGKEVKMNQEVCKQEETGKKPKMARQHGDIEKILSEAGKSEECENLIEVQQKVYLMEVEKKLKKANGIIEDGRRDMDAYEREENERRLKETLEREKYEERLKEAIERAEIEKRREEALEQEEKEQQQRDTLEREEKGKRQKEACEREENEKRLKEAREREEKQRKEVLELKENEKRLKEALDCEDSKRLKMALKWEEYEKRQKLALEREENEKSLREDLRQEEIDKKSKVALEQEDNAKKQKEAHEREENEDRLNEACKREEDEKRRTEVREQEKNKKRLQEAHKREESEKKSEEAFKHKKTEQGSEEVNVCDESQKRIEDAHYWGELKGQSKEHEQNERDESERKLKSDQGTFVHAEGENFKTSDGACKLDNHENQQPGQVACKRENRVKAEKITGNLSFEEDRTMRIEPIDSEGLEAVEVVNVKFEDKFNSSGMAQDDSKHEKNQIKMKDAMETLCLHDTVMESGETGIGIGQTYIDRNKKASKIASSLGTSNVFTHELGERGTNVKDVQLTFDKQESKDKFMSSQVVGELIENGRKMGTDLPTLSEGKRNAQCTTQKVNTSQSTERKEQNLNDILTPEEREKEERIKRERKLEKDRLRKIEEEREREKDRMAVDRATLEAHERAFVEARERAEKVAVERATAKVRQRAMEEARERLEKASTEARERSLGDKVSVEARLRAERAAVERATAEARERAAVERATAEARERAFQKAMVEKAAFQAREHVERSVADKSSASYKSSGMRQSSSYTDGIGSSSGSMYSYSSVQRASYSPQSFVGVEGESAQRCKARLERHGRTAERAAKALAEKNMRDLLAQREQAERNRLAETLDTEIKRWSSGKEGNLRALLSTLQYILGPDSGWQPIPLTEVITAPALKKAYRKATLCIHPDKLQQRRASIQQKYICEKVFDLLKEAWNRFNSEER